MSKLESPKPSFTDEDFLNLIKNDPAALKQYIRALNKLYTSELIKNELIKKHIDKQVKKSMQLLYISHLLIFIRGVSNPERYLKKSKGLKNK